MTEPVDLQATLLAAVDLDIRAAWAAYRYEAARELQAGTERYVILKAEQT